MEPKSKHDKSVGGYRCCKNGKCTKWGDREGDLMTETNVSPGDAFNGFMCCNLIR